MGGQELTELGATLDDAAGEAFDKVARLLGLGFPGGPLIDRAARDGDPDAIAFPRGMTGPHDDPLAFSFSGLKTAVARWVEARQRAGEPVPVADVAASFQEAVVDVLSAKAVRAATEAGIDHLLLGGGVAANSRLRALTAERCERAGLRLRVPRPKLCTDNGAMVAALGAQLVAHGAEPSRLEVAADSVDADRRRAGVTAPHPTPSPCGRSGPPTGSSNRCWPGCCPGSPRRPRSTAARPASRGWWCWTRPAR